LPEAKEVEAQKASAFFSMFIPGFTFDDVLLVPKYSTVKSRADVDLSVKLPRGFELKIPLVTAPMKTVCGPEMAKAIADLGGLALLHRFDSYEQLYTNWITIKGGGGSWYIGVSIGVKEEDFSLARKLYNDGCKIFCVDVAHGDHETVRDFVIRLRDVCADALIIAGNVATPSGAQLLWEAGADIIRAGVGPGSLCSTRIETGNGYPQLSALKNIKEHPFHSFDKEDLTPPMIIADGGIRSAGDCVKALCFSDLVMIGNLFAGTDEAPGDIITVSGQKFKQYVGSSTHKQRHVEGVVGLVPYKGPVQDVVTHLVEGIRSGCSYQGVHNLQDLKKNPEFVVISNAGLIESHPHNVRI